MTFLGLELNAGLAASMAVGVLAVLWNYSSLPEVRWTEITAGVMSFVAGAGVEYLAAGNALGTWTSVSALSQVTAVLYTVGGLLLLVGGALNAVQQLQRQYA
ncbi:MAG: hypothetical protein ABEJ64_03880 [Candidatus Nanohaloarchaea archaeon]